MGRVDGTPLVLSPDKLELFDFFSKTWAFKYFSDEFHVILILTVAALCLLQRIKSADVSLTKIQQVIACFP